MTTANDSAQHFGEADGQIERAHLRHAFDCHDQRKKSCSYLGSINIVLRLDKIIASLLAFSHIAVSA